MAHQCQIHGPAHVGDHTFVGMQALVFRAKVGSKCVIDTDGKYVPAGSVITTQANNLPDITEDYPVVHVNEMFKSG